MISYAAALAQVTALGRKHAFAAEILPLHQANHRVAAETVRSIAAVPRFANSQVDGFAVRAAETPGELVVAAKIVAGDDPLARTIAPGHAVTIMTGAPIPDGFDAVIKVEDTPRIESGIRAPAISAGTHVRPAGEDFQLGDLVVERGRRLDPAALMALAATGRGQVEVAKKPRIALIATGLELTLPGEPLPSPGAIWCSSLSYLQAALGAEAELDVCPIVRDDPRTFQRTLDGALARGADIVITTGAVSAGEHDFIPRALDERGAHTLFHKVAIRPGKPVLVAEQDRAVIFALPGNPVSTAVGLRFFLAPFLRAARGEPVETPLRLRLTGDVRKNDGLRCFFKARRRPGDGIEVLAGQASHLVRPLLHADSWAILPEAGEALAAGETIDALSA